MESLEDDLAVLADSIAQVLTGECDRIAVHAFFDGANQLDRTLWATAAEQGWLGLALPEAVGGLGFGARGYDVLLRQLGRFMAPGLFLPTLAGAQWLAEMAPGDLCAQVLPRVLGGGLTIAVPLVPGKGEQLALAEGKLSGRTPLMFGSFAPGLAVVPASEGERQVLAVVDTGDIPFARADFWDHTRAVGRFTFDGAAPLAVIADAGAATAALRKWLALGVSAESVGAARAVAEQTIAYLKEREQFGRALASFQALKHRAADLWTAIVLIEAMLEQAVEAVDTGSPDAAMWVNLAKASIGEKYHFIAQDSLQLHGGVGFTWEFDCHIHLKRALLGREIAGSAGALRDLAGRDFAEATRAGITTAELAL